jgi:hypothetical protein
LAPSFAWQILNQPDVNSKLGDIRIPNVLIEAVVYHNPGYAEVATNRLPDINTI